MFDVVYTIIILRRIIVERRTSQELKCILLL